MSKEIPYENTCFVIMPFGKKRIKGKSIDFDKIYDELFAPAISHSVLPEGGNLIPRRTDKDFYSGSIDVEMHRYLEYSRMSLADITGLKPNVFYELGIRHHAHSTGTAIFKQANVVIPFDIKSIKAFTYNLDSPKDVKESGELITKVLTDTLVYNRLDSPVQAALMTQKNIGSRLDKILTDAINAIRNRDLPSAISKYHQAIKINVDNPTLYQEIGLLYKEVGNWQLAIANFKQAIELSPTYSDAHRELGIAENKLYHVHQDKEDVPTGKRSLKAAITYNNQDFDAYASLGGILKRDEQYEEALAMYRQAINVSDGHPYPLLNALKLQVLLEGAGCIDEKQMFLLERVENNLVQQTSDTPPYDAPWSFFNLSDIRFLKGDHKGFIHMLEMGLEYSKKWHAQTHLNSLKLMTGQAGVHSDLEKGIALLEDAIANKLIL